MSISRFWGGAALLVVAACVAKLALADEEPPPPCEDRCWEGLTYYTYSGYCDHFDGVMQAAPNIYCLGNCYNGTPSVDEGTVTRKIGSCVSDCSNDPGAGVPRQGSMFSNPYMTFDPEAIKKCPRS